MRVCICIKKPSNLFTNGCFQQSLFLWKMLNKIEGLECDMVSVEPDYKKFDENLSDDDIVYLTPESVKSYKIVFTLSLTLNVNNEKAILKTMKENNIKLVDVLCGNLYVLLQEEFTFDVHHIMKNYRNDYIDEVWVLEMYAYAQNFLEMVYAKPVKVLKYVWGSDIIQKYISLNNINPVPKELSNDKINICIYEANMSLHKNAFIPLLIAENFFKKFPNRLNKCYMFCKEKMNNNGFYEKLDLCKQGKFEYHPRMIMPTTIDMLNKSTRFKTVVLSNTMLNNLNFLHLELLHMGVPIVHNCAPFNNGLYYDSFKLHDAVDLLEKARKQQVDSQSTKEIIENFNYDNKIIQTNWFSEIKYLTEESN